MTMAAKKVASLEVKLRHSPIAHGPVNDTRTANQGRDPPKLQGVQESEIE